MHPDIRHGEKIKGKWFVIPDAQFEHHLGHKLETNEHHLNTEANLQREIISKLEKQTEIKDQQIDHITQLLAVQTKTNALLADRLQVIEDMRHRPWWRFW